MKKHEFAPILFAFAAACGPLETGVAVGEAGLVLPPGTRIVNSRAALVGALRDASFHGTIYVPPDAFISLTGERNLPLREGVTLLSQREGTTEGAWLFTNDLEALNPNSEGEPEKYSLFDVQGNNVRVEGLRLQGPSMSHDSTLLGVRGIEIDTSRFRNLVVINNELYGWPGAAISVTGAVDQDRPEEVPMGTVHMSRAEAGQVLITANHIHHNVRDSSGYGVVVGHGAYATVEGNVFDFNRHAVACDGRPFTGYIAHLNYVLEGGYCEGGGTWGYYNQHFDVHGRGAGGYGGYAGEYFDISYNTVRGEQMYDGVMTRPALMLRGSPSVGAYFNSNVLCHDDSGEAVRLDDGSLFASAFSNVFIGTNRYNLDPSNELLTGDFDGDGKDDVLLGNGTARFVSRAGQTSWRLIGGSPYRRSEIAVGRFDSNGKDDVFVRASDGGWYFSSAASGPLTRLGSSGVAMSELRFGDFDGDGLTDIFRADGTKWWVSWSGRSTWSALNTSVGRVADLRFGDFDGDGTTDVFSLSGGQWSYARGGKGSWQRLNSLLSSDLSSLVFADFDGDGKSDIAQRDSSNGWRYSQRGQTAWRVLRTASGQTQFADPRLVVFGDFDGDGTADALRFDTASRRFVRWSSRVGDAFAAWSRHDMR